MNEALQNIIYIFITGVSLVVVKEILRLLNKKVDEAQANSELIKNENLNSYIDHVQRIISDVVLSVNQTYVESMKAHNTFTKDAHIEAKNKAIEMAKSLITDESKNMIVLVYGDFDAYLNTMIESLVAQHKTGKTETN
jgi:hypothetical protein